jgi:hypothetical protein
MEQLLTLSWQIAGVATAFAVTAFVIAIPIIFIILLFDDSARDV